MRTILYTRAGREWRFTPLPVTASTAEFMLAVRGVSKAKGNPEKLGNAVVDMLITLPPCVAKALRQHTPEEIEEFCDTLVMDMENPDEVTKWALDLQALFMGRDPAAGDGDGQG